ncbi:MAG: prepilin-type N-terminal cleavage/methylation domain-containing protein [Verrucomicrobiota bacterium]|nr:prepilin-type N-terminal cleavage/methylation domain-containing protein [Verrucomicrobiota bacterium]
MDCKITSINRNRRAGMTLVEFMISGSIAAILLSAVAMLTFYTGRSFASMANYIELDQHSRGTLDQMSQQIRQTTKLLSATSQKLVFLDHDGSNLTYVYNPTNRTLIRQKTGQPDKVLLTGCDNLEFNIFQRNPINGTYNQYPTANAATCKLVQLRWTCSRDNIYSRFNTESVQSARIVIRKQ